MRYLGSLGDTRVRRARSKELSVLLDDERFAALDGLVRALGRAGVRVTRASVVRAAIDAGSVVVAKAYGLGKAAP